MTQALLSQRAAQPIRRRTLLLLMLSLLGIAITWHFALPRAAYLLACESVSLGLRQDLVTAYVQADSTKRQEYIPGRSPGFTAQFQSTLNPAAAFWPIGLENIEDSNNSAAGLMFAYVIANVWLERCGRISSEWQPIRAEDLDGDGNMEVVLQSSSRHTLAVLRVSPQRNELLAVIGISSMVRGELRQYVPRGDPHTLCIALPVAAGKSLNWTPQAIVHFNQLGELPTIELPDASLARFWVAAPDQPEFAPPEKSFDRRLDEIRRQLFPNIPRRNPQAQSPLKRVPS